MSCNGESNLSNGAPSIKIGFKFNKTNRPKSVVVPVKLSIDDFSEKDNVDFVTSIDNKKVKGSKGELPSKSKELVIPLIAVNKYNIKNKNDDTAKYSTPSSSDDISSQAKQELIEDGKKYNGDENDDSSIPAWKLMIINKVPDEYENDSKLDVSLRPDVSTLDDYESVPIEAFGSAVLRGMGWKNGDPIGGINKAITPVFEPQLRPRGLGLGADASLQKQLKDANNPNRKNDEALIRKGSFVCIEAGSCKGRYGTVESINDDLSHVLVRLNLLKESIDLPHAVLRVVTKKEFDEEGRIINKSKYDDYKLNNTSNSSQSETKKKDNSSKKASKKDIWVIPNIRAEIISDKYKDGKYYKEKVVILETNADRCTCRTKSNRVLEDIPQSILRTVIPRKSDRVMILRGEYKGKLATIEHSDRYEATVKLVGTISKPFSLSLDDISEYYNH